jgi:hypothetical protein
MTLNTIVKDLSSYSETHLKRVLERVNIIKVHNMHVWKFPNETFHFLQFIYANKNKLKSTSVNGWNWTT